MTMKLLSRWSLIPLLLFAPLVHAADLGECASMVEDVGEPESADENRVLCRIGYLVSYNPAHKTPDWVLEALTPDRFKKNVTRDNRGFVADPDLPGDESAITSDYTNSGYDRGHMSPAADNTWSEDAMAETFYLSNIVPQYGPSMNRGIWKQLEEKVRDWAVDREKIIVVSGPVYSAKPKTIGGNKVAVPTGLYKIIYDPDVGRALAFYFDNKPYPKAKLDKFITTVREIEDMTGITFFTALDNRTRNKLETSEGVLWR